VTFEDCKVLLYRQDDRSWVAEVPALRIATAGVLPFLAWRARHWAALFFKILRQLVVSPEEFDRLR
jgi:hypothetical protein